MQKHPKIDQPNHGKAEIAVGIPAKVYRVKGPGNGGAGLSAGRRIVLFLTILALLAISLPEVNLAGGPLDGRADQFSCTDDFGSAPASNKRSDEIVTLETARDRVRVQTRLVNATLTVADRYGECVTGLTKENFHVFDNGVKQEIAHFSDEDTPVTLGIVYDVSGSMSYLSSPSFETLKSLFELSHEDDQYFVIAFNDHPILVQDFTISPSEILGRVVSINAKGGTALYDAVYLGVEKARQGRHHKKALLVISDGLDNVSLYGSPELRNLLQEADVPIYSIGLHELSIGAINLKNLSEWSGGRAFFPADKSKTFDAYVQVANMLRRQYQVGFYPSDTASNVVNHKVLINVSAPSSLGRLSLYYKKAYEAFR